MKKQPLLEALENLHGHVETTPTRVNLNYSREVVEVARDHGQDTWGWHMALALDMGDPWTVLDAEADIRANFGNSQEGVVPDWVYLQCFDNLRDFVKKLSETGITLAVEDARETKADDHNVKVTIAEAEVDSWAHSRARSRDGRWTVVPEPPED